MSAANVLKYIKDKGANLGIDKFGESAPYKEVYKHFKLILENSS
jgi:transketolase